MVPQGRATVFTTRRHQVSSIVVMLSSMNPQGDVKKRNDSSKWKTSCTKEEPEAPEPEEDSGRVESGDGSNEPERDDNLIESDREDSMDLPVP